MIAVLLCKQNSHGNSSSPIIWVSSLSLFANAEGKKGGKKEEGWGEREEKLLDHSLLPQNPCHRVLEAWLLCQTSCGRCEALEKELQLLVGLQAEI